jgi:hypothetical protein
MRSALQCYVSIGAGLSMLSVVHAQGRAPTPGAETEEPRDSAGSMVKWCNLKYPPNYPEGRCMGIIEGMLEVLVAFGKVCPPRETPMIDFEGTVVAYIEAHPERMQESFASLAYDALVTKWPCSKQ